MDKIDNGSNGNNFISKSRHENEAHTSHDEANKKNHQGQIITAKSQGNMTSFSSESLGQFRDSFRNRFSNAFVSKKVRRKRLQEIELSQVQDKLNKINSQTKFILI